MNNEVINDLDNVLFQIVSILNKLIPEQNALISPPSPDGIGRRRTRLEERPGEVDWEDLTIERRYA